LLYSPKHFLGVNSASRAALPIRCALRALGAEILEAACSLSSAFFGVNATRAQKALSTKIFFDCERDIAKVLKRKRFHANYLQKAVAIEKSFAIIARRR
jgi:hypothetical protein